MYEHLTDLDLNRAIGAAADRRNAIYRRMIGSGVTALISPFSPEWALLEAAYDEQADLTDSLYDELVRREQETGTDA